LQASSHFQQSKCTCPPHNATQCNALTVTKKTKLTIPPKECKTVRADTNSFSVFCQQVLLRTTISHDAIACMHMEVDKNQISIAPQRN
jgi:hypothetical protein